MPWGIVARYAGTLAAGIAIGWTTNGWRLESVIANERERYAVESRALAEAAANLTNQARAREQAAAASVSVIDKQYQEVMANAAVELESLRDAVAAGTRQLRIRATCPAAASSVPGTAPAPGVDNETSPRLADTAERDYFRLRDRLTLMEAQIGACQAYIKEVLQ